MTIKYNFFNRIGGVSKDEKYKSFNCAFKTGDNPQNIAQNQQILKEYFQKDGKIELFFTHQVHSDKVLVLDSNSDLSQSEIIEADGIVTNLKNIILAITTADCCPIIFYDETKSVIGACHAGWKGAHSDSTKNLINIMIEKYACDIDDIQIKIGPTIRQKSYQVQQDFYDKWIEQSKDFAKFFEKDKNGYYFDLCGAIIFKLETFGIKSQNIEDCKEDTFSDQDYFSYRRMIKENLIKAGDKHFGCNISAIAII